MGRQRHETCSGVNNPPPTFPRLRGSSCVQAVATGLKATRSGASSLKIKKHTGERADAQAMCRAGLHKAVNSFVDKLFMSALMNEQLVGHPFKSRR